MMRVMTTEPTIYDYALAAIDAQTFDHWISDPQSPQLSGTPNASPTKPSERLARMVLAPATTAHGQMAIIDAMLAAQIKKSLEGDTSAFKVLYNELEHGGVHKTANMSLSVSAEFTDEINSILQASGLAPGTTHTQSTTNASPEPSERQQSPSQSMPNGDSHIGDDAHAPIETASISEDDSDEPDFDALMAAMIASKQKSSQKPQN